MPHLPRQPDGSAGDVDYAAIGPVYNDYRTADPRITTFIHAALGDARTVLNVGAGTGSYEPPDRIVTAVEPSESMRARRPAHLPPAIDAYAESLPFPDRTFDASMASVTVHQWQDLAAGLGGVTTVKPVPIPLDCTDGFNDAYYGRPERFLDPAARRACSSWGFVSPETVARFERALARDLADGTWDARHGHLRSRPFLEGALVLVVSVPGA